MSRCRRSSYGSVRVRGTGLSSRIKVTTSASSYRHCRQHQPPSKIERTYRRSGVETSRTLSRPRNVYDSVGIDDLLKCLDPAASHMTTCPYQTSDTDFNAIRCICASRAYWPAWLAPAVTACLRGRPRARTWPAYLVASGNRRRSVPGHRHLPTGCRHPADPAYCEAIHRNQGRPVTCNLECGPI